MVKSPSLAIQVASMRLPETIEFPGLSVKFSKRKATETEYSYKNDLQLYPNEAEEILVTVENTSSIDSRCSIELPGDYCLNWLKSKKKDLHFNIPPHTKVDKPIKFEVDADFFEKQSALNQNTQLQLDYQVEIQVYLWLKNISIIFLIQLLNTDVRVGILYLYKYIERPVESRLIESQLKNISISFLIQLLNTDVRVGILYLYKYIERPVESRLIEYQVFNLLVRPETSYLDFLPAIFRETDAGRRFVSIFEQAFNPVAQTTDVLWAYFNPLTAPEAFLPFLSQWVGWEIDKRWTIEQQRRLIHNAVTLYRYHGTKHGLRLYLHCYTDLPLDEDLEESQKHISIEEDFNNGFVLGEVKLNENPMLGGGKPYHFTVRLRADESNHLDEELVREIIERYKPAFSTYELSIDSVNS